MLTILLMLLNPEISIAHIVQIFNMVSSCIRFPQLSVTFIVASVLELVDILFFSTHIFTTLGSAGFTIIGISISSIPGVDIYSTSSQATIFGIK